MLAITEIKLDLEISFIRTYFSDTSFNKFN